MDKTNIIIVEDEWVIAADIEDRLTGMGYHVCAISATGEKAIELVNKFHPDLVLMDIKLRGEMDGIKASELIKTNHDIPVIFLTAFSNNEIIERAKMTEPFGYILKPVQSRELNISIEMALYKSKMEKKLTQANAKLEDRVKERTSDLKQEIEERKRIEIQLKEKTSHLEDVNAALKSMLDSREIEKRAIEQNVMINIRKYVLPYFDEIEKINQNKELKSYFNIIRSNLKELVSPASKTLFSQYIHLTPAETKVADCIRFGKSTKEIAQLLNIAPSTVSSCRNSIRKKLDILNTHTNLRSYLNAFNS